jgi:hypothetical protein
MSTPVQIDANQFNSRLAEYITRTKKGMIWGLRDEGKNLLRLVTKLTPPSGDDESTPRTQGRKRVESDIRKVIKGWDRATEDKDAYHVGGEEVVRMFVDKKGTVWGVDKKLFRPDATVETLAAHHNKNRDKRGRVTTAGEKTRDIGRWKFIEQMVAPEEVVKQYIQDAQFRVGRGKGGWAKAWTALGEKPANWIATWIRLGEFEDTLGQVNGFIRATNRSEWANRGDDDRVVSNAMNTRKGAIANKIADMDRKAAERALK